MISEAEIKTKQISNLKRLIGSLRKIFPDNLHKYNSTEMLKMQNEMEKTFRDALESAKDILQHKKRAQIPEVSPFYLKFNDIEERMESKAVDFNIHEKERKERR